MNMADEKTSKRGRGKEHISRSILIEVKGNFPRTAVLSRKWNVRKEKIVVSAFLPLNISWRDEMITPI